MLSSCSKAGGAPARICAATVLRRGTGHRRSLHRGVGGCRAPGPLRFSPPAAAAVATPTPLASCGGHHPANDATPRLSRGIHGPLFVDIVAADGGRPLSSSAAAAVPNEEDEDERVRRAHDDAFACSLPPPPESSSSSFVSSTVFTTPPRPSCYDSLGSRAAATGASHDPEPAAPAKKATTTLKKWTPQLTKIVATIGPTSEQLPVLQELVDAGLRVMRLNFSHATVEEVELRVKNLKACQGRHGAVMGNRAQGKNVRAILLDTRGPEIRTGKLRDDTTGKYSVHLVAGDAVTLQTSNKWLESGSTESDLYVDYPKVANCLTPGMKVLLDDGAVTLTVESTDVDAGTVTCRIENSGDLRSRAGVNLPGADTDMPAMSEKDRVDIKYGLSKGIDFIAASFIQSAANVHEIRAYVRELVADNLRRDAADRSDGDVVAAVVDDADVPIPLIISKIESVSALRNFDEILDASDGIMVARGDLGVEIPIQQITNAQKEIIAACNSVGKPVVVATQMLESMAGNPRPTRAEVADVTNAVYDGADAVMLSGETAKGKFPVESVRMMNEIIMSAEKFVLSRPELAGAIGKHANPDLLHMRKKGGDGKSVSNVDKKSNHFAAVAKACVTAAEEQEATAIIVLTKHGTIPRLISAFRPNVPIVAFCPNEKVARQLILHRGVHPMVGLSGISAHKRPGVAIRDAKAMGFIEEGDDVVIVTGEWIEELDGAVSMRVATVL